MRWLRLWRLCAADLRLLWFALRHPRRPGWLAPVALLLLIYAIDPLNFALPWLGAIDDLVLVPLILHLVLKLLPEELVLSYRQRGSSDAAVIRRVR